MNAAAETLPPLCARRFAPTSLDELVSSAALLTRIDRKYLVDADDASAVLSALDESTRVLEIEGEHASRYGTMYFDTPELLSYHLAAHGRRRRFKIRARRYVDTGGAFLEMKTRGARGVTVKERVPRSPSLPDALTGVERAYAAEGFDALGLPTRTADDLVPTLHTAYRRTTLLLAEGARATIDTDLVWTGADGSRMSRPDLVIVETKSASRASELDRILWRCGVRPAGVSKFATGLAAMRPDLPSNRWHRVLRRHFPDAEA